MGLTTAEVFNSTGMTATQLADLKIYIDAQEKSLKYMSEGQLMTKAA